MKYLFYIICIILAFTLISDAQNVQSLINSTVSSSPSIKSLPGKSLKKSNGTNSYIVDYWPILWSWYLDLAPHGEQALLYYRNPKAVNGGWEIDIMYEFQVALEDTFKTIVYTNRMIEDRYNYRKWPTHSKKWLDTIGIARPNPDTTYWVMRDSSWVIYGTTYYSRVNMRWFRFQPDYFNWTGWGTTYYDSTYKMYVFNGEGGPWSNTMSFTMNAPLPVELVAFNAIQEGTQIKLRWKTYSETMCAKYIIKRQNEIGIWEILGEVPGSGTTNYTKRYSFIDNKPLLYQTNYYQLMQLNNQGITEDLWIAECNMTTSISRSYPNPANEYVIIPFVVVKDGNVTVKVYDILGSIMEIPIDNIHYSSGNYFVEINTMKYPSGIYIYNLILGSNQSSDKMLVVH